MKETPIRPSFYNKPSPIPVMFLLFMLVAATFPAPAPLAQPAAGALVGSGLLNWREYAAIRNRRAREAQEPAPFSASDLKTKAGKQVYSFVEKNPVFPGGNAALKQYLLTQMPYLRTAASQVSKGRPVVLIIVVNEEGIGEDIHLIQPRIVNLEAQTRQALSQMPVWKPGRQGKNAIPVAVTFPIMF